MVWNTGRKSRKLRKKNVIDEKIRQFQYPCWNRYGSFLLCHRLGKQKQLLASGVANGGDSCICNGIGFRRFMKKAWMPMV